MQIDIHGNIEEFIQSQLAAGKYQNAQELLEAMAAAWKASHQSAANGLPLPGMQPRLDVAKLSAAQGVKPCRDVRDLQGGGWPADDSVEEFETFLRQLRNSGTAGDRG